MLQRLFTPVSAFLLALAAASSRRSAVARLRRGGNGGARTGFPPPRLNAKSKTVGRLITLAILPSFLALRVNAVLQCARGKGSINP